MTTSEMTTNETSKTSEKKYQTSGCACGPKNCETKRPSAQAPDPKSSKPHKLKRAKNTTVPERALITPAMKAFKKAGGTDRRLSKKKPLPEGYYLLQARRRLSPQLSSVPQYAPS